MLKNNHIGYKDVSKILFTLATIALALSAGAGQGTITDYQEAIVHMEHTSFTCLKVFEETGKSTNINATKLKNPDILQNNSVNVSEAKNGTYNITTSIDVSGTKFQKHRCRSAKLQANKALDDVKDPKSSSRLLKSGVLIQLAAILLWFRAENKKDDSG
jgi:hypothetical protein